MKKFVKIEFNSHENHNPSCDILCGYIDKDSFITYGVYVTDYNGIKKGSEFMEYYSGENYVLDSTKKSNSRAFKIYEGQEIPEKYREAWLKLKRMYYTTDLKRALEDILDVLCGIDKFTNDEDIIYRIATDALFDKDA